MSRTATEDPMATTDALSYYGEPENDGMVLIAGVLYDAETGWEAEPVHDHFDERDASDSCPACNDAMARA